MGRPPSPCRRSEPHADHPTWPAAALVTFAVMLLLSSCGADDGPGRHRRHQHPDHHSAIGLTARDRDAASSVREIEVVITADTVDTAEDSVEVAVGEIVRSP